MTGRSSDAFLTIREFGAIGNGLSYAIGVAAARPETQVVLIDGDGGFLMHAQELETVARHGIKLLMIVMNDAAYGSEIHKLRVDGHDRMVPPLAQPILHQWHAALALAAYLSAILIILIRRLMNLSHRKKLLYGIFIFRIRWSRQ